MLEHHLFEVSDVSISRALYHNPVWHFVGDLRGAGLRAAQLGQTAEQNGDLDQAINLYRQSIHYLEQAGAPEAGQVWQRLTAAELKLKLEPVFQAQGETQKDLLIASTSAGRVAGPKISDCACP